MLTNSPGALTEPSRKGIGLWRDKEHLYTDTVNGGHRYVDFSDPLLTNDIAAGKVDINNPDPNYKGRDLCGSEADGLHYGWTAESAPQRLLLCPATWDEGKRIQSLEELRTATVEKSWAQVNSLQGVWLHEVSKLFVSR